LFWRDCRKTTVDKFSKLQQPRWSNAMKILRKRKTFFLWAIVCAVCAASAIGALTLAYAANGSVAYTYDALGRVTTASYDTHVCIIYSYDPNGNRLSETINVTANNATGVWGCFDWNATGSTFNVLWGH
jgi:hypothetical protein